MGTMVNARDLLVMPPAELWGRVDEISRVEFDDGVLNIIPRLLPMSRYMWVFQELYPETPLTKDSMIQSPYITTSTCQGILERGLFDCYYATGERDVYFREHLARIGKKQLNLLYNDSAKYCVSSARGASAIDYLRLIKHPPIAAIRHEIKTNLKITPRRLIKLYDEAKKVIMTDPALDNCPLCIGVRCRSMKIDQLIQCVIARGFGSDVDGVIFKELVRDAYIDGIRTLDGVLVDACSASRAIFYQKKPTQDSEYLNRRLRMNGAYLKRVHFTDCGTLKTVDTAVTKQNLPDLAGKYYLEGDKWHVIRKTSSDLIGKVIKRRSNFSCIHEDREGVCAKCYGDIALSIPHTTNLGVVSTTTVLSVLVQLLLSAKHIILSSVGDVSGLNDSDAARWMYVDATNPLSSSIYLKDIVKKGDIYLTLRANEAKMLADLMELENLDDISSARLTSICTLFFSEMSEGEISVDIESGNSAADNWALIDIGTPDTPFSLSRAMLKYVLKYGYQVDMYGNYVINMKDWDLEQPFLDVPVTQASIPLFIASVDRFITSSSEIKGVTKNDVKEAEVAKGDDRKQMQANIKEYIQAKGGKKTRNRTLFPRITDFDTPMEATNALYEVISKRLSVNITHLEAMVLALTANDPDNADYRLPLDRLNAQIISYPQAMRYRSISALLAFENQATELYDISNRLVQHRAHHPYDELFKHFQ